MDVFVGMFAFTEGSFNSDKAHYVAAAISQNLYVGNDYHDPYCHSSRCIAGVFNFIAAESKGGDSFLKSQPSDLNMTNYSAFYPGLGVSAGDDSATQQAVAALGAKALDPNTVVGDRHNGPSIWGNVNGAQDLVNNGITRGYHGMGGPVYYIDPSFILVSNSQYNSLTVDLTLINVP